MTLRQRLRDLDLRKGLYAAIAVLLFSTAMQAVASGPASASVGPLGSQPAVAIGPQSSGGEYYQYVFWQGLNGGLWETWWNGSWQPQQQLPEGTIGSAPTAVVGSNGVEYVFWKGTGAGNLWMGVYTPGSGWAAPFDLGGGTLGSAPSASIDGFGDIAVVWDGENNNLWEKVFYAGNGWSSTISLGFGPLGSPPTVGLITPANAAGARNVFEDVVWQGTGPAYDLWQANGELGDQLTLNNEGLGPLNSQPGFSTSSNDTIAGFGSGVYWMGTGPQYDLWEFGNTCTSISSPCNLGDGPLGSAPAVGIDPNLNVYIFWWGENGGLWETFFDRNGSGSWSKAQQIY
jgi:hypothetical protein